MNDDDLHTIPVAERFRLAIRQFNARLWFQCHETLESIWMDDPRPRERRFFQGILQIAVGLLHLSNGNFRGARNLLERGTEKLNAFRPSFYGVHVAELLDDAAKCHQEILRLGPERLDRFDPTILPVLTLDDLSQLEKDFPL